MSQIQQGVLGALTPAGGVPVAIIGNSTLGSGSQTVATAGTRVQLSAISVPCKKVTIQSLYSNSGANGGVIFVGDNTVSSSNGIAIPPYGSVVLTVNNLNLVYLDASDNNTIATFLYEN